MGLFKIFEALSMISVLLPIAISLYKYSSLKRIFKVFFLFLLLHAVFNVISWYTSLNGIHNLPLYHTMTVVEFSFYSFMYYKIAKETKYKNTIKYTIGVFVFFCILNAMFLENIHTDYNSNTRTIGSLILVIYAISYFYRMLKELTVETVEQEDMFWFNTGVLIFFAGTFFQSLFLKVFFSEASENEMFNQFLRQLYSLHYILYLVLNILLVKAIWVSQRSK